MIVDLSHNKIVAVTMSDAFSKSFQENLIPKLSEKYGNSITLVQMYEDYIADGFTIGGEFYYPLTVVTDKVNTQWIKWKLAKGKFEENSPYAFLGDSLSFSLVEDVPKELLDKLSGRAVFSDGRYVKVRVESVFRDVTILSGKYSQTFIDEMARQLTPAIEEAMSCRGIGESGIELCIIFAPDSYMEHTCENVTYRRFLITDNSGAPRDFWIKWTRLDSATAYTVASHPASESILFEIGEDVSQKIREKEYRFLLSTKGKDKYHNAMGRKNITEWREVIKRAIRRGELEKVEQEAVISEETDALTLELLNVIGKEISDVGSDREEVVASKESDEALRQALEFARSAIEAENSSETVREDELVVAEETEFKSFAEEELIDEDEFDIDESEDELDEFYKEETDTPVAVRFDEEEEREIDELSRQAKEALQSIRATEVSFGEEDGSEDFAAADIKDDYIPDEDSLEDSEEDYGEEDRIEADPCAEEFSDIEDEDSLREAEDTESLAELDSLDGDEDDTVEEKNSPREASLAEPSFVNTRELEEKIRSEIEAKLRLEYERDARRKAEVEAERLRRENEKLLVAARNEEVRKAQREKERLEEAEKLKTQIEAQLRAEARERERLAEAARAAVEEQRRLEEEKARLERIRLEEERHREAEARAKALEEERAREAERIRRETEERIRAEYERKAREAARDKETREALASADESAATQKGYINPNYTYVSKNVKLLFRRSVDPNITGRIHEIIKATLDYYGKSKVYLKIKATVPDTETVILEFIKIPMEEMELLGNIIKVLGNSGLGIAKAIVE